LSRSHLSLPGQWTATYARGAEITRSYRENCTLTPRSSRQEERSRESWHWMRSLSPPSPALRVRIGAKNGSAASLNSPARKRPPLPAPSGRRRTGRACSLCTGTTDINLFRYCERIVGPATCCRSTPCCLQAPRVRSGSRFDRFRAGSRSTSLPAARRQLAVSIQHLSHQRSDLAPPRSGATSGQAVRWCRQIIQRMKVFSTGLHRRSAANLPRKALSYGPGHAAFPCGARFPARLSWSLSAGSC
jgi:hypothetical protein